MENKTPLYKDILEFSRKKKKLAAGLIALGILGIFIPIIPGFLLIGMAVLLLKPEWWDKIKSKFE